MTTLLATPAELRAEELRVEGDAYRHLFRARRLAVGDALRIVDGEGRARAGRIATVDRRSALVALGEPLPSLEPELRVELLVAPPRSQRARWLVEKATELGAAAVRFVLTERTVREPGDGGLARLRRVAAAAVEQCGRARVPAISGPHPWSELAGLLDGVGRRWLLTPEPPAAGPVAAPPLPVVATDRCGTERCALLVGPEGGWTAEEHEALEALDCHPLWLGPRILRTETAGLAGLVAVLDPARSAAADEKRSDPTRGD
jgi:16S rRNA (uracil1498-N3)-methyltransferase